jgi:hypothetical protein
VSRCAFEETEYSQKKSNGVYQSPDVRVNGPSNKGVPDLASDHASEVGDFASEQGRPSKRRRISEDDSDSNRRANENAAGVDSFYAGSAGAEPKDENIQVPVLDTQSGMSLA